ncbi:hypothetical protein RGU12_05390 [Fredinandcohnia sp. QZ13]|uniref:hypothetical protein n=1 Tax=Fredinandcohnia sp. QZ13 TaxID=3073144 RepID=UPI0028535729|nr:hypothetical protein [Fredinandcohnia sp. QZ13]MDR4886986.1 hypothetical protein [Fredinandcohnia sp. QZ13]
MGKSGSSKDNERQNQDGMNQVGSNPENTLNVNAPGGISIQVLGMDISMRDLSITIGPDANISEIHSILDQIRRRS